MNPLPQPLHLGWRLSPLAIAVACAAALFAAAVAIRFFGLPAGLGVLALAGLVAAGGFQQAEIDGRMLTLCSLRTAFAPRLLHARAVERVAFRRGLTAGRLWLSVDRRAGTLVLVLCGRSPDTAAFRAIALWMIVHGRREARIDPRLLDALAVLPHHEDADQHDPSHA